MGLSKFPDALPHVNLPFGGNISEGSLCIEVPLIRSRRHRFLIFRLLIITYIFILFKAFFLTFS
jgi:hypothetical protein